MSHREEKTFEADEPIFLGEFEHSLDTQRRIAIPSAWRSKDGENRFVVVPGRNRILQMIPFVTFKENFLDKAKKVSPASAEGTLALARFASKAQECRCDKQGRIQINQSLLDYAGFSGNVMLIGAVWQAQLWDLDAWKLNQSKAGADDYFDELEKISSLPDDLSAVLKGTLGSLNKK